MTKLYIKAEFTFVDLGGHAGVGKVGWLRADWDEVKDRYEFAYETARDYLKQLMLVEHDVTYIIALKKGEVT